MWFPSYKWNPGTAEPNQLLTYQTSGKGSIASVLMKKKKKKDNSVPMILALFAVALVLATMP